MVGLPGIRDGGIPCHMLGAAMSKKRQVETTASLDSALDSVCGAGTAAMLTAIVANAPAARNEVPLDKLAGLINTAISSAETHDKAMHEAGMLANDQRIKVGKLHEAMGGSPDAEWTIVASEINYEDPTLYCDHCNARIESAYAEDEPT